MTNRQDRVRGSLLGLACGDALGTTVEFRRRDTFALQTELTGGGAFNVKPGEWTDDTAMALCLAESLIERGAFDPRDQLTGYLKWFETGHQACQGQCIDIGNATRSALRRFASTKTDYAGSDDPFKSGNGGIMRLAPAVLAAADLKSARVLSVNSSRTTHASADCLDGADLLGGVLWRLVEGEPLAEVLANLPVIQERGMPVGRITHGFFRELFRDRVSSSGYVIDTLEAALWCCHQVSSAEEAIVLAANLGDDADTVAAVTGQIAGAAWGASALPQRWLDTLAWREHITGYADALADLKLTA